MTTIGSLPPSVLSCLTAWLDPTSLVALARLSGDSTLWQRCSSHGGVLELRAATVLGWRSLTSLLSSPTDFQRLTHLCVSIDDNANNLYITDSTWVRFLPPTLLDIRFRFTNSIETFFRPLDASRDDTIASTVFVDKNSHTVESLSFRFPNLQTLHLSGKVENRSRTNSLALQRFLDELPASITSCRLSSKMCTSKGILHLPRSLSLLNMKEFALEELGTSYSVLASDALLQVLKKTYSFSSRPPNIVAPPDIHERDSALEVLEIHATMLRMLPPLNQLQHLTSLSLEAGYSAIFLDLALPLSLTKFHVAFWTIQDSSHFDALLQSVPQLLDFSFQSLDSTISLAVSISYLPPALRALNVDLHPFSILAQLCPLPTSLTKLRISAKANNDFMIHLDQLPALTDLSIANISHLNGLSTATTLKRLSIGNQLDLADLKKIPSSISALDISLFLTRTAAELFSSLTTFSRASLLSRLIDKAFLPAIPLHQLDVKISLQYLLLQKLLDGGGVQIVDSTDLRIPFPNVELHVPASVKELDIRKCSADIDGANMLFKDVTRLSFRTKLFAHLPAFVALTTLAFAPATPKHVSQLPTSLTDLTLLDSDQACSTVLPKLPLLRRLVLVARTFPLRHVHHLLPQLDYFHADRLLVNAEHWPRFQKPCKILDKFAIDLHAAKALPVKHRHASTVMEVEWNEQMLRRLPEGLEEAYLEQIPLSNFVNILPKSLTKLSFSLNIVPGMFFARVLPSQLISLSIQLPGYGEEIFQNLPKSLLSLSVVPTGYSNTAIPITASIIQLLPRSLTSLTLAADSFFAYQIENSLIDWPQLSSLTLRYRTQDNLSSWVVQTLPKTLLKLCVPANDEALAFCAKSLPRLLDLHYMNFTGDSTPQYDLLRRAAYETI